MDAAISQVMQDPYANANYPRPTVEIGEHVLWYPNSNVFEVPFPARVVEISSQTLRLSVLRATGEQIVPHVRHCDDPHAKLQHNLRHGCWGFPKPSTRELELLARIAELEKLAGRVERLEELACSASNLPDPVPSKKSKASGKAEGGEEASK